MCYEGKIVIGVLEDFDLDHKIAFVQAMENLDVYCVPLNPVVEWMPETAVVAVARDVSGKLMATTGKLERSDGEAGGHHIMFSTTCKLPEVHLHYYQCFNHLKDPLYSLFFFTSICHR